MTADRIEVTPDEKGKGWLIRITIGEEVIRRHCDLGTDAGQTALREAALKTAVDEGYTVSAQDVYIG